MTKWKARDYEARSQRMTKQEETVKGLELAREYFEEYGRPMLEEGFKDLLPYLCCGLIGEGSECFGFDDQVSVDHDFEPGFCIFLPGEDAVSRQDAFKLERAYAKLPKEFKGFQRARLEPVGGARHGVIRTEEFFSEKLGHLHDLHSLKPWLIIPEQSLAEVTNGEIYFDNYGEVSNLREMLSKFPEDVKRKKLASHLLLMAQAGQYNYMRCLSHGESAAAQLAAIEFARHAMAAIFLINDSYQPYYKWSFRALRNLPKLSLHAELLEFLITTDNEEEMAKEKYDVIEGMAADIIDELIDQDLTKANCGDLEKHAYSVNDGIADSELRNMHILAGV